MTDAPVDLDQLQSYCDAAARLPGATAIGVDSRELARLIAEVRAARSAPHADEVAGLRTKAEALWGLLDDIDTLGDSMKPERSAYFEAVDHIARRRHEYFVSLDGMTLLVEAPHE